MIRKELVFVDEEVDSQSEAIEKLVHQAVQLQVIEDEESFLKAIYRREEEFSTAVGFGVAIPHGMSDTVREAFVGFMKPKHTILWGNEQKEVDLLFMIGVPESRKNVIHLKLISQISKNLMKQEFREKLLACKNNDEAFQYLEKINEDIAKELN
ncbi:PTS sugar transporter subunit IIA [Dielma fastidiosa]|uniref:Fructose PTS transporter subunit IIA n=1 Tax=Dielma fastidiosa TaxID=1034346 RepID=A0AB35UNJ9_9FIRM|nr:fructose PTS transporter subunit IIA [Dielma fastidiosa]MDY5166690.1 fructose PTS transporter subunit IIA [Dielma fastidiosa]